MSEHKTKEEILSEITGWGIHDLTHYPHICKIKAETALRAMQLYDDQQTASKDREITDLKSELESETDRLNSIIHEELTRNDEYKDMMDEKDLDIDQLKKENEGFRMENKGLKKEAERLKFMIENGLGPKDMINDITMPHEI